MKTINWGYILFLIATTGCKKHADNTSPINSGTNTPSTIEYSSSIKPQSWQGKSNGVFILQKNIETTFSGNDTSFYVSGKASLSTTDIVYPYSNNLANVNSIVLNGIQFKKTVIGSQYYYTDSTLHPDYSVLSNWVINGSSDIPSFSIRDTFPFPTLHHSVVPDSVSLGSGLTVILNGNVASADSIVVSIGNIGMPVVLSKTVSGISSTVFFSQSELTQAGFSTSNGGTLTVLPKKLSYYVTGNKIFVFERICMVSENVLVTP